MNERVLVDTNILLAATDSLRMHHSVAKDFLERHSELVAPAQVFREYVVVATRPIERNGLGLTVDPALANLTAFRSIVALLPEEKPLLKQTIDLVATQNVSGARIHDVAIVAAAIVHGVKHLATFNAQDFASFTAINIITPNDRKFSDSL